MSRLRGLGPYVFATVGIAAGLYVLPGVPHHAPDTATPAASPSGCSATVVAEDGTPPPGVPHLDPPDPVNARAFCIEVHRRGCGDPTRDCNAIPADQTYYHHH